LAATQLPVSSASAAQTTAPLATLLDIGKCVACGACVEACGETNGHKYPNPQKPYPKMYPSRVKVEEWSHRQDVDDRLTPYNWLYIQSTEVEIDGETVEINIPRRCMHCHNPPCVKLCPWGAARQYDNGISTIDADLCMGGAKCRTVCPWEIPQRQTGVGLYLDLLPKLAGNGVMYKCDRCYDRVAQGELPACIDACPEEVQTIGPRDEIVEQAKALARETNGHIYGLEENGGTNTLYVSPVPFDQLNVAIEKGKGRPHLAPVEDVMADNNKLARAMLIAPLAGIAAAVGRFYKHTK
jgi:Fe-S-cluster-containing dehydrogenase component